jgi:hypothetical protein
LSALEVELDPLLCQLRDEVCGLLPLGLLVLLDGLELFDAEPRESLVVHAFGFLVKRRCWFQPATFAV